MIKEILHFVLTIIIQGAAMILGIAIGFRLVKDHISFKTDITLKLPKGTEVEVDGKKLEKDNEQ